VKANVMSYVSPAYLREQAMLFLAIAKEMSDPSSKAYFEKTASEHTLRAEELEEPEAAPVMQARNE
jgi:hypothetical protein